MPYIDPDRLERIREIDLLTYLQTCEPHELVRLSSNVYTTREHDSLKISNGKWCWWSRGIGGRSALDFLIKVRGKELPEAVEVLERMSFVTASVYMPPPPKPFALPKPYRYATHVVSYLMGRGIDSEIIDYCISTGRLYESAEYHNAVFVGFDETGKPRYAALRGIGNQRYFGEVDSSDKRYSFSLSFNSDGGRVHVFECAIDLLSYATLLKMKGEDWRRENFLSLAGVYKPRDNIQDSTPPAALIQYLKDHPQVHDIALHLDNDVAGRLATKTIIVVLPPDCVFTDEPPEYGKDVNDQLKKVMRIHRPQINDLQR
jgi:hypothetical protein